MPQNSGERPSCWAKCNTPRPFPPILKPLSGPRKFSRAAELRSASRRPKGEKKGLGGARRARELPSHGAAAYQNDAFLIRFCPGLISQSAIFEARNDPFNETKCWASEARDSPEFLWQHRFRRRPRRGKSVFRENKLGPKSAPRPRVRAKGSSLRQSSGERPSFRAKRDSCRRFGPSSKHTHTLTC